MNNLPTASNMPEVATDARLKSIPKGAIPPFLFRASCNDHDNESASRGFNSAVDIDPLLGTGRTYHENLAAIGPSEIPTMIYDHIKCQYLSPSEFSS